MPVPGALFAANLAANQKSCVMPTNEVTSAGRPLGWLVVNTHTHKEPLAEENLKRQGFDTYCPKIRKTIRHARRAETVLRPLFAGYIFVAPPGEGGVRWRQVHSTFGVRAIVGGLENPGLLDSAFIKGLKAREIDGAVAKPQHPYRPGQAVRLTDGAFEGMLATILDLDDKGRITVLMTLLNRPIKVHTALHGVREA